jgi:hypothetical protein
MIEIRKLENAFGMELVENGEILGAARFTLSGGKIFLNDLQCGDGRLRLSLGKAMLHWADLRGAGEIFGGNAALAPLYTALRFKKEGKGWRLSLKGYFGADVTKMKYKK